jgi:hypothetical protein
MVEFLVSRFHVRKKLFSQQKNQFFTAGKLFFTAGVFPAEFWLSFLKKHNKEKCKCRPTRFDL